MNEARATGRWRHRFWRGRLVLQVEEHLVEEGRVTETRWRDATIGDLTVTDHCPVRELTE